MIRYYGLLAAKTMLVFTFFCLSVSCFACQTEAAKASNPNAGNREVYSGELGVALANAKALRSGDVLFCQRQTFDSVNRDGRVNESGILRESVVFWRVTFDLDAGSYCVLKSESAELLELEKVGPDDAGITRSHRDLGSCRQGGTDWVSLRQFPGGLAKPRLAKEPDELTMMDELGFPDLRTIAFTSGMRGSRLQKCEELLLVATSPERLHWTRHTDSGPRLKLQLTGPDEYRAVNICEIQLDNENMMPVSRTCYTEFPAKLPGVIERTNSVKTEYEWTRINGIDVPTSCRGGRAELVMATGKRQIGWNAEELTFHWLRVNQPIEARMFDGSCLANIETFREQLDPQKNGAPELTGGFQARLRIQSDKSD